MTEMPYVMWICVCSNSGETFSTQECSESQGATEVEVTESMVLVV